MAFSAIHRVQESDGNFFESFTALAWKQENRRRRVASEDEAEAKKPPPPEIKLGPKPTHIFRPSRKEYEQLYIEVLYTIQHKIGQTTGHHLPFIQDLYHYAREAFGINAEEHARLLSRASEEKPPILVLECTVLEARDLEAKDADGFSDPYCMLGILPGDRPESRERQHHYHHEGSQGSYSSDDESQGGKPRRESSLKKFTQSFKRKPRRETARDMVPARFIKATSVKPNTLNPVWNEKFRFDLENVQTDRIHMDIWDHDDEFSVVDAAKQLNQVQGFKGLGRYFKQIAQSARTNKKGNVDDFLGSVNVRLNDIPSIGAEEWYDLEGRSSRSNVEGQIHLRLKLATREDRGYSEEDNWDEIKEHEDLMCVFIEHEMKKFKGENYQWTGELCQAANTILHQHAIQGDITDVQQSMCRWSAYARKHREHPCDWSLLLRLLEDLDEKWEPASLSRDEEENLAESFNHFIDYSLELIKRQRLVYPPANKAAHVRLLFMLRCLAKIYDMPVFQKCCPFQKPLHTEIVYSLRKSNAEWYDHIRHSNWPSSNSDEDTILSMISLTNTLNTDMQKALQYYTPIYEKHVSVNYFAVVYRQLEKLLLPDVKESLTEELGDDINKDLERVSFIIPDTEEGEDEEEAVTAQMMGTQLFELYLALHEFCKFAKHLPGNDQRGISITSFYDFYRVPVQRWLNISKYKAMRRIKKAVDLDKELQIQKVGQVEGTVKQSTSAVDVACCFGQVIEFWKSMEWPDYAGALPFITKITEDLCQGSIYYADLIHEKLKAAGYYDEIGQFDVTEQLCRTINDIEQVRRSLKPIPDALRFEGVITALERVQGNKISEKARWNLYGILHNADDNMVRKIKQVVDRVADKMRPDIKKFVFHLCWSAEKVPAADAISELMHYLDSNLLTLNNNLLRSNFDRILDSIWVEVLEEISDVLDKEEVKAFWFFSRLFDALDILVDFFHANDKGLSMDKIHNPSYQSLRRRLTLNKSHTNNLIEIFYCDKMDEQDKYEGNQFGTISVRVYYNQDAEILSVEVLNARNVIPLDPNGLSDPFVLIELVPRHVFPGMSIQQTQIIKRTLNPTFDESFEFTISASDCRHVGACIHFTVMDHDLLLTNDFAGESFLSLNTIPGISGEEISGFSALTPLNLPLTQPKRGAHVRSKDPLDALRIRDDDKDAQEFVKKRRNIEAQSQI